MIISRIVIADDHSLIRTGLLNILQADFPCAAMQEAGDGFKISIFK